MKWFLSYIVLFCAFNSWSQTDLIILTNNCYNFENELVLEELKVFKGDTLIKEFDLDKKRPFYTVKNLASGFYSVQTRKLEGVTQTVNFVLDSTKQRYVNICIDSTNSENIPIIDQLENGNEYFIQKIVKGYSVSRSTIYIKKMDDKYYARLDGGRDKKLTRNDIKLIRSFENKFYSIKNLTNPLTTTTVSYIIKFRNKLFCRNNFIGINLNDLKLKSN